MTRIYELTDRFYRKYYVAGLRNDKEAGNLALKVFGRFFWPNGISFYDTVAAAKKRPTYRGEYWMPKSKFVKFKRIYGT